MAEKEVADPGASTANQLSRRDIIKSVIAAGAVSSTSYLFRVSKVWAQASAPGAVDRLITLNVNGQQRRVDVMKQETLVMTLRYKLGLTGTKIGCDQAECGACTVLIDDVAYYSCSVFTHTVRDKKIVTIEKVNTKTPTTFFSTWHLAIIHAAGSPDTTRSHFDAQDYMESGTPGMKATQDGWLNRALQAEPMDAGHAKPSAFRAVALGTQVPRTLQGKLPAIAISNLADFSVGGKGPQTSPISDAFQAMYDESTDAVLHGTGQETFEAVKMLKAADPAYYQPAAGVVYPNTPFGNSLKQIAQLLKADLGVEAAFSDIGGWDTHQNQGNVNGQLANRLKEFSESIAAFWKDMGTDAENVTLVTMSEFGRTARQNGTGGTDHGHANVMFVLGGPVKGGKVYGKWPGLSNEQLNEGRDLAVTTDFRRVLGEAAYKTLGSRNLDIVFPGAEVKPDSFLNFI